MLNKVFLQGRLVADPELRHTQQGTPVASFRLAVDRGYKSKDPNAQNADFVNVVSWRNTAEFVCKYFTKGRMMLVEGRLQMRDYTDKDGNRRVAAEIVTDNVYFCDSRTDETGADSGVLQESAGFSELADDDGDLPF